MKTKLASLFAFLPLMTAAHGTTVLLAGFDGNQTENNASNPKTLSGPLQDPTAVGKISVVLSTTSTLTSPGFDWAAGFQGSSILWGTTDLAVDASTANNNAVYSHDADLAMITVTINNTGTTIIDLESLHMRVKRDNAAGSATGIRVTYQSGDLSDTDGVNNLFALNSAASTVGYDFSLSSFMSDLTLGAGESAVFTWASEGGTGSRTRFDNVALSGVIPEPSAVLLGSLGLLALLRRRR